MYNVYWVMCIVYYALHTIQCKRVMVWCTLDTVQYIVQYTVQYIVQYSS